MTLADLVLGSLGAIAAIIVGRWLLASLATRDAVVDIDTLIKPPTYRFKGADEALAQRTRARRAAADAIHARAHKVETGAKVGDVLRMIKK